LITITTLIAAGIAPTQARMFAEPLARACERFGITTPAAVAAFIGQCRAESADFTRLEEGLYYTTPERIRAVFPSRVPSLADAAKLARNPKALANRVYASRLGNGDEASGDGYRFIGRGLIQLTGRDNYTAAAADCGKLYLERPDLVAQPEDACLTAAWFWASRNLSTLADSAQWDAITRAVNGPAMLHSDLRRQYTQEGLAAFA